MPINTPTIINELRENTTEEQRKGLSILENRFYECLELKKESAELVQKMHILKNTVGELREQLKEANELLKAYGTESLWESLSLSCDEANNYLEKWGVK